MHFKHNFLPKKQEANEFTQDIKLPEKSIELAFLKKSWFLF